MDRQRSSSFKPTRVLFFSLTLTSSLLLCISSYLFVLSSYSSILHEKTHIHLDSLLETAVGGRLVDFSGDHHGGSSSGGGGRGGKSDLGCEESDSFLETKAVDLETTNFTEGVVDSTEEVGDFPLAAANVSLDVAGEGKMGSCDIYEGRWVFDRSYPVYDHETCPFIDEGFSCHSNGRLDGDYMKWRWQPSRCDLPRFDAVKMLETIRGKRLVFAGDSINRNQWESLLCMLRQGVSDPSRMYEAHGRRITKGKGVYSFRFPDYQCSVEYYVTHFLVHEGRAKVGKKRVSTLHIDSVDRSSAKWRGADILVFNTAHWWSHHKTKAGKNYFQEGDMVHPQLNVATAFRKALSTWASWIDRNIDPRKTTVFFRSSSPSHYRGGEWNSGGHCQESTHPLNETASRGSPMLNVIVEQVLSQMKTPVTILNVTTMSGLRIDGHPSVYGKNSRSRSWRSAEDCSHWCLPGVPDVWNELLYYNLLSKQISH